MLALGWSSVCGKFFSEVEPVKPLHGDIRPCGAPCFTEEILDGRLRNQKEGRLWKRQRPGQIIQHSALGLDVRVLNPKDAIYLSYDLV